MYFTCRADSYKNQVMLEKRDFIFSIKISLSINMLNILYTFLLYRACVV